MAIQTEISLKTQRSLKTQISLKTTRWITILAGLSLLLLLPQHAFAMHIMEGFLPPEWALGWGILYLLFLFIGLKQISKIVAENSDRKVLLALCAAFIFVLSALKIPSVTGSCSHPTGMGLGVALFGPWVMSVLGGIVLLFQSLFLAHGGLTTLGANGFSMAVAGPFIGYAVWVFANKLNLRKDVSIFLCAVITDLSTYVVTSIQLGMAFPNPQLGMTVAITEFLTIFAITQVPIAIAEGLLTVIIYDLIVKRKLVNVEG